MVGGMKRYKRKVAELEIWSDRALQIIALPKAITQLVLISIIAFPFLDVKGMIILGIFIFIGLIFLGWFDAKHGIFRVKQYLLSTKYNKQLAKISRKI